MRSEERKPQGPNEKGRTTRGFEALRESLELQVRANVECMLGWAAQKVVGAFKVEFA